MVDRGRKYKAIQLSQLLLGQSKFTLISGSYTAPGQLLRSVRNLTAHAIRAGERKALFSIVGGFASSLPGSPGRTDEPPDDPPSGSLACIRQGNRCRSIASDS